MFEACLFVPKRVGDYLFFDKRDDADSRFGNGILSPSLTLLLPLSLLPSALPPALSLSVSPDFATMFDSLDGLLNCCCRLSDCE